MNDSAIITRDRYFFSLFFRSFYLYRFMDIWLGSNRKQEIKTVRLEADPETGDPSLHIKITIKDAQCFTGALHTVMHHCRFLVVWNYLRQLPHIGGPGKIQNHMVRESRIFLVQRTQGIRLHCTQVEYLVRAISRTCTHQYHYQYPGFVLEKVTYLPTGDLQKQHYTEPNP